MQLDINHIKKIILEEITKLDKIDLSKVNAYLAKKEREKNLKTFTIENWDIGPTIYQTEAMSLKEAVEEAVRENVSLKWADLHAANLRGSNLQGADLQLANLQLANLNSANLQEANLRGADLREADLERAILERANLQGASFYLANLHGANLMRADLRGANLRGVNLLVANLQGADLRRANLRRANLRFADLCGANLRCADLNNVAFSGADLCGAKFSISREELFRIAHNVNHAIINNTTQFNVSLNEANKIDLDDIEWGYYEESDKDKIEKILRNIPRDEIEEILRRTNWYIFDDNSVYNYDNTIDFFAYMLCHDDDEAVAYAHDILHWYTLHNKYSRLNIWRADLEKYTK